jgi:hypothetical protein
MKSFITDWLAPSPSFVHHARFLTKSFSGAYDLVSAPHARRCFMKWLGASVLLFVVLAGVGCSWEFAPDETTVEESALEPARRLTSPNAFNRQFGTISTFDNAGVCVAGQPPRSPCIPDFVTFGTNAQITELDDRNQGLLNTANDGNERATHLIIEFSVPVLKVGFFLLPQAQSVRKTAMLTGYDGRGRRVTSASMLIPRDQPSFFGIATPRELRKVILRYNADFAELIDDLHIERACADVQPDPANSLTTKVSFSNVTDKAHLRNFGNASAHNVIVELRLYTCDPNCPADPAAVAPWQAKDKTISSLGSQQKTSVTHTFTGLSSGRYLVGYFEPENFSPRCTPAPQPGGLGFAPLGKAFIGEEVHVR